MSFVQSIDSKVRTRISLLVACAGASGVPNLQVVNSNGDTVDVEAVKQLEVVLRTSFEPSGDSTTNPYPFEHCMKPVINGVTVSFEKPDQKRKAYLAHPHWMGKVEFNQLSHHRRQVAIDGILRSRGVPTLTPEVVPASCSQFFKYTDLLSRSFDRTKNELAKLDSDLITTSIQTAVAAIKTLRQYHDLGLVFGSPHPLQLGAVRDNGGNVSFKFISGPSLYLETTNMERKVTGCQHQGRGFHNSQLSPNVMRGSCLNRFDDLFYVAEELMNIVGPIDLEFIMNVFLPIEEVIARKRERRASRPNLPVDRRIDAINDFYQAMLDESGNLEAPDYEWWMEHLTNALKK